MSLVPSHFWNEGLQNHRNLRTWSQVDWIWSARLTGSLSQNHHTSTYYGIRAAITTLLEFILLVWSVWRGIFLR